MTCTAKNKLSRLSPSGSSAGKDMVFDRMRDFEKKLVGFDLLFFCAIPATDWVSLQNMSRLIFYSMAAIFI